MENNHIIGALAALGSAFLWSLSAILFQQLGRSVSSVAMNLGKGLIALLLIGLLILPQGFADIDQRSYLFLALSGIMGICIGDTIYFKTLSYLGSRLTLLISSLIPVTTGVIAVMFLGEQIGLQAWLGVLLTVVGVTFVLWFKSGGSAKAQHWRLGLITGVMFVLANALGIIFTKMGVDKVPSLDATFVRTLAAVLALLAWGVMARQLFDWVQPLKSPQRMRQLAVAAFIGAFLGTWLSVLALKYTHAAVAAALNSTGPLFILPLAYWMLKEKITVTAVAGAAIAVAGIALYFTSIF